MAAPLTAPARSSLSVERRNRSAVVRTTRLAAALAFSLVAATSIGFSPAAAQVVDTTMWVTDGWVNSVVRDGNTIYLGGFFGRVDPVTGGGVPLDATSGALVRPFPKVTGEVRAAVPDGSGGWFLGGAFSHVHGEPRSGLAHVRADGTLSPWTSMAAGWVDALVLVGNRLYVGGMFVPGISQSIHYFEVVDTATGLPDAAFPDADGEVFALAVSGNTLYLGGDFTSIGGQPRNHLAALDASTGSATAWDPDADGLVNTLAVSGSTVYAGGEFANIGGEARNYLAALDATNGLATPWSPEPDQVVNDLDVSGNLVYACGLFSSIGGEFRSGLAALDSGSGLATSWDPGLIGSPRAVAVSGNTVYAGGVIVMAGLAARNHAAAFDATTGLPTPWNPNPNGWVSTLAVSGGTVYMGGTFTGMGGVDRFHIAAIDATSGHATSWNPSVMGIEVNSIATGGGIVYAGGLFSSVGGQPRSNLVAIDAASGNPTTWNPGISGGTNIFARVETLLLNGGTLYVGGEFTDAGGASRNNMAAIDAATGFVNGWNPAPDSVVTALAVGGSTVYAGGGFSNIGGQARTGLAALDASTGQALPWNPNPSSTGTIGPWINRVVVSGATIYAGGFFTSIGGQTRNHLAALDATTGQATPWEPHVITNFTAPTLGGRHGPAVGAEAEGRPFPLAASIGRMSPVSPHASRGLLPHSFRPQHPDLGAIERKPVIFDLAVSGNIIYVCGAYFSIGGQPRSGLAALDATTGQATSWDPNSILGNVYSLSVYGGKVYMGGLFPEIGNEPQSGFAATPDSPTGTLLARFDAEVRPDGILLRWQLAASAPSNGSSIERAERETGPWMSPLMENRTEGEWMAALDRGAEAGKAYWYRLNVTFRDGRTMTFGPIRAELANPVSASGILRLAPNPAVDGARIECVVANRELVRVSVVDIGGREIDVLAQGIMEPGRYSLVWDGRRSGAPLSAGVYFVRWQSPGRAMQRRLVLMH